MKDSLRNTRICLMGYLETMNCRNNDNIYLEKDLKGDMNLHFKSSL